MLFVSLVLFSPGCNVKEDTSKNRFYYYPDKNVYYDIDKQVFFYSIDGTKTWKNYNAVVNPEVATLGKKVEIITEDSIPYNKNDEHRKLYVGRLYDLTLPSTAATAIASEVGERKTVVKKKPVVKAKPQEKQKKGLGKFFSKLFGKKNKK
jgi:hypothetical protein